jgi:hypothetical protein
MSERRGLHRNLLIGVGGCLVIVLFLVGMFRSGGQALTGPGRILVGTAGVTVLVVWWGVFATRIMRAQDECQRWMERRAWHTGGLAGLLASVPVFTFIGLGGLRWLNLAPHAGPAAARAFMSGYLLPLMLQVAGSTAYALWWRLARR